MFQQSVSMHFFKYDGFFRWKGKHMIQLKKQVRIIFPKIKHDIKKVQPAPCSTYLISVEAPTKIHKHKIDAFSLLQQFFYSYDTSKCCICPSLLKAVKPFLYFNSLALQRCLGESQEEAYIQVFQCEDHGVGHKYAAWLLGYGCWQDVGVDSEGEVVFVQVPQSPQCGILRAEKLPQVFVEHKDQLCHTYSRNIAQQSVNCLLSVKRQIQSLIVYLYVLYIGCNLPNQKLTTLLIHSEVKSWW